MNHLFSLAIAAVVFLGTQGAAQSPVVVELYTSQGCSSCPPADKLMQRLAKRDDVIALALHVDYWDYIGWKDEFAVPANTKRQRGFAAKGGRRSIYTPQMIVNGTTSIVGARPMDLSEAISEHAARPPLVKLALKRNDDAVMIEASPRGVGKPLLVQMVRYQPERTSRITRGENAGRTLTYTNVTQDWETLTKWDGQSALQVNATAKGDLPVVVIVQEGKSGPIVAAARLP